MATDASVWLSSRRWSMRRLHCTLGSALTLLCWAQHQGLMGHLPHYTNAILCAANAQMHSTSMRCALS